MDIIGAKKTFELLKYNRSETDSKPGGVGKVSK